MTALQTPAPSTRLSLPPLSLRARHHSGHHEPQSASKVLVCLGNGDTRPPRGARLTVLGRYLGRQYRHRAEPLHVEIDSSIDIGRSHTSFRGDIHLHQRHARLSPTPSGVRVHDLGSVSGAFVRVRDSVPLIDGTRLRIGRQTLTFREFSSRVEHAVFRGLGFPNPGIWGRLDVMIGPCLVGHAFSLVSSQITVGRQSTSIAFTNDPAVSSLHCRIRKTATGTILEDNNSHHGTYKRLHVDDTVPYGSTLLLGRTLVRIDAL